MGTTQVNMHEAKSRLSELGELAQKGEKVVIARAGKPYLDLLPHREHVAERKPGRLAGKIRLKPDFDQTPDELVADFEGQE
ncbi:MAG: type II toxin-antitoxin system prevent-host-death family antitoxin [Pseudomonadales bacterium]|jgi:antitoxin (DNA-binding transcriptional repressor) of toxin-antitoxin stability system|nr:type II toxin-antitoxin system prevent-host-death family antitoxin [Pseudomonadales bacterium]